MQKKIKPIVAIILTGIMAFGSNTIVFAEEISGSSAGIESDVPEDQKNGDEGNAEKKSEVLLSGDIAGQEKEGNSEFGEGTPNTSEKNQMNDLEQTALSEKGTFMAPSVLSMAQLAVDTMQIQVSEDEKTVRLQVRDPGDDIDQVRFAVWSSTNGQDDICWLDGSFKDGIYSAEVGISEFNHPGDFIVHSYAYSSSGQAAFLAGGGFWISSPALQAIEVGGYQEETGELPITLNNLVSKSGIISLRAAVWCADDQSDLYWYNVNTGADGYSFSMNVANHRFHSGDYKIHIYAVDGNGFQTYCGGTAVSVDSKAGTLYVTSPDGTQRVFRLAMGLADAVEVRFAVWSEQNGQDDLHWYTVSSGNGSYVQDISISDFNSTGRFFAHCYMVDQAGNIHYVAGKSFMVDDPHAQSVSIELPDPNDSSFDIHVTGVSVPSGVVRVEAAVWSTSDQSNLKWYSAAGEGDGDYVLHANLEAHGNKTGTYNAHIYVTDGNGFKKYVGGASKLIDISYERFFAEQINGGRECRIRLDGFGTLGLLENVEFAVWSQAGDQSDLKWYVASPASGGYEAVIDISKHLPNGIYSVHAYVTDKNGNKKYLAGTRLVTMGIVETSVVVNAAFTVTVSHLADSTEVKGIQVTVYPKNKVDKAVVYDAEKTTAGTYSAVVKLKDFSYEIDEYIIVVDRVLGSGALSELSETSKTLPVKYGQFSQLQISENKLSYYISLQNVDLLGMQKNVQFAVWSVENGQDDLVWYTGVENGTEYQLTVPIGNHKGTGEYLVHCYYELPNGVLRYLNGTSFEVQEAPKGAVQIQNINGHTGNFEIDVELGQLDVDVAKVMAAVWAEDQGGSICWFDLSQKADRSYQAVGNVDQLSGYFGTYAVHIYVEDEEGGKTFLRGTTFVINADNYISVDRSLNDMCTITIYGANLYGQSVDRVRFPSWSVTDGQDDIIWYEGVKLSDGVFQATVNRNNHAKSGEYLTHLYAYIGNSVAMIGAVEYSLYRSGEFDEHAQEVMHNIIFAVETGGQIYGNARYNDFTQAYTNSDKETAITIGAGGWFATEAQRLLRLIREEDPVLFAQLDTAGISEDVDNENWTYYGSENGQATLLKGSEKAVCIQALISSEAGIRVQNRLVDEQMCRYVEEAKALGVTDLKAQMFLANVRHLGGYGPMEWVVECCIEDGKALTMENLWTSMRDHTENKAGNGVGADKYKTRHEKVMLWLNTYLD